MLQARHDDPRRPLPTPHPRRHLARRNRRTSGLLGDLTTELRPNGLGLAFRRVFHEEEDDQPDLALDLTLSEHAPSILGFAIGGLAGRWYWDDATGILACTVPIPGDILDATQMFSDGTAHVTGSSAKNAARLFIMWTGSLTGD